MPIIIVSHIYSYIKYNEKITKSNINVVLDYESWDAPLHTPVVFIVDIIKH